MPMSLTPLKKWWHRATKDASTVQAQEALQAAVQRNDVDTAKILLEQGVDPNAYPGKPLFFLALEGDQDGGPNPMIDLLLPYTDPRARYVGATVLALVMSMQRIDMVNMVTTLLKHPGAAEAVRIPTGYIENRSCLQMALLANTDDTLARLLLPMSDVNHQDKMGFTCLIQMANNGCDLENFALFDQILARSNPMLHLTDPDRDPFSELKIGQRALDLAFLSHRWAMADRIANVMPEATVRQSLAEHKVDETKLPAWYAKVEAAQLHETLNNMDMPEPVKAVRRARL